MAATQQQQQQQVQQPHQQKKRMRKTAAKTSSSSQAKGTDGGVAKQRRRQRRQPSPKAIAKLNNIGIGSSATATGKWQTTSGEKPQLKRQNAVVVTYEHQHPCSSTAAAIPPPVSQKARKNQATGKKTTDQDDAITIAKNIANGAIEAVTGGGVTVEIKSLIIKQETPK